MKVSIIVKGKHHRWAFDVECEDPQYLQDWRDDGLDANEIVAEIPADDALIKIILAKRIYFPQFSEN